MNVDLQRSHSLTQRLLRLVRRVEDSPEPEVVHHLRTTIRRLETLMSTVERASGEKMGKLEKQMAAVRRRAGTLRDVDVQLGYLKEFRPDSATRDRTRVLRELERQRAKRLRKLQVVVDEEFLKDLKRRLARFQTALAGLGSRNHTSAHGEPAEDPVGKALEKFARRARAREALTENNLHDFRMQCKRLRYLAEMGGDTADSLAVVEQFKRIQDGAGEWHDWLTLTQTAERVLGAPDSILVSSLRLATHSRFVEALSTIADAERKLLALHRAGPLRKRPQPEHGKRGGARTHEPAASTA